ncbi:hypothetical protein NE865_06889 [Phthorimaea operculella]|nr:hypothetical protein NE865_06889 [Phthorimaea operculella]
MRIEQDQNIARTEKSQKKITTSRSASPSRSETQSLSPENLNATSTARKPKPKTKKAAVRQNVLTVFEFSTVYPFFYAPNIDKFKCYVCSKLFSETFLLREHMIKKHTIESLKKVMNCKSIRYKVLRVDVGEIACKICSFVTEDLKDLKRHLKDEHNKCIDLELQDNMIPFNIDSRKESYDCVICQENFNRIPLLISHMNVHFNNYTCKICDSGFMTSYHLRNHLQVHANGPPKKIVPLFQVAYDRSLCKPLGTLFDFGKLRTARLKQPRKDFTPSRSVSPVNCDSPLPPEHLNPPPTSLSTNERIQKLKTKAPDVRQNVLTVFEFSTVYPFIYGNNKFKCFVCSQPFLETSLLRKHMNESHTFAPLKRLVNNKRENILKVDVSEIACKICSYTPKDFIELKRHLKGEHNKSIDPELQDNMIPFKIDGGKESYDCVICQESFIKVRILVIHMSVHFNNYSCEICGSGFMTLRLLKKHLEVHENGNFPCDRCNKVFTTTHKRALHIRGVHLKQYPRRCPMCPERFNSNYRRTIHLQDVHNVSTRVHKCLQCGRAFNLKYHLICHTRSVHLQERNQACDLCHQRFCNKETLKRHMVIHTGEKNYKCEVCGMAFLRRKNLKDHLRLHDIV